MKKIIKLGICFAIALLSLSFNWATAQQFQPIVGSGNNSWETTATPPVGAVSIGTGYPASFSLPSAFVINGMYTNPTTGNLFRTDGAEAVDNLWQMFTGTGNGVTEKGRIFTTPNWTPPTLNTDFNIKATQGSLFLYSVDASNNNYHVMIDSKYVVIETTPKVKPEVANGDIAVTAIGSDIMFNAPNGNNYYPITVDNTSKLIIKF